MTTKTLTKPAAEYIPDTSEAERWESEDVFVYKGQRYQLREDYIVVQLGKNGKCHE